MQISPIGFAVRLEAWLRLATQTVVPGLCASKEGRSPEWVESAFGRAKPSLKSDG